MNQSQPSRTLGQASWSIFVAAGAVVLRATRNATLILDPDQVRPSAVADIMPFPCRGHSRPFEDDDDDIRLSLDHLAHPIRRGAGQAARDHFLSLPSAQSVPTHSQTATRPPFPSIVASSISDCLSTIFLASLHFHVVVEVDLTRIGGEPEKIRKNSVLFPGPANVQLRIR